MLNSIPYTKSFVFFLFSSSSIPPLCGHVTIFMLVIAMHGYFYAWYCLTWLSLWLIYCLSLLILYMVILMLLNIGIMWSSLCLLLLLLHSRFHFCFSYYYLRSYVLKIESFYTNCSFGFLLTLIMWQRIKLWKMCGFTFNCWIDMIFMHHHARK
jgi:hypothetical protein